MVFDGRLLSGVGVFIAVVDHGSFSRAGEALGLTKSGVSRAIARLEARVSTTLLERRVRPVLLTIDGQALYRRMAPLLVDFHEAVSTVRTSNATLPSLLRIFCDAGAGQGLLGPRLADFLSSHPGISIDLSICERPGDIGCQPFDLGVSFSNQSPSGMVARPLGASRMILCASPAYLARHGVPGTPSDLEHGHQFVLVRETATSALEAWAVRRGSEMRWLDARPRLIVNRPEAALAPLVAGAGIGELCAFLAESYLRSGDLVELLPHWQDHRITAYVHRPFRTLRNDAVEAFIAFLDELAIGGKSSADTDADTARCHALPLPALPAGR